MCLGRLLDLAEILSCHPRRRPDESQHRCGATRGNILAKLEEMTSDPSELVKTDVKNTAGNNDVRDLRNIF
jgi:hypothetical protein